MKIKFLIGAILCIAPYFLQAQFKNEIYYYTNGTLLTNSNNLRNSLNLYPLSFLTHSQGIGFRHYLYKNIGISVQYSQDADLFKWDKHGPKGYFLFIHDTRRPLILDSNNITQPRIIGRSHLKFINIGLTKSFSVKKWTFTIAPHFMGMTAINDSVTSWIIYYRVVNGQIKAIHSKLDKEWTARVYNYGFNLFLFADYALSKHFSIGSLLMFYYEKDYQYKSIKFGLKLSYNFDFKLRKKSNEIKFE